MTGVHALKISDHWKGGKWMEKYIPAKINYKKAACFSWMPQESLGDSEARVTMESKDGALEWKWGKWLR